MKNIAELIFNTPRLVFFKNLFEKEYEDVNLGILLNDNKIICLACNGVFKPDKYKIISVVPFSGILDFKYITDLVKPKENDTINTKKKNLMIMSATIDQQIPDECLYSEWIKFGVSNCPSDSDLESIANDSQAYKECYDLFCKILKKSKYSE